MLHGRDRRVRRDPPIAAIAGVPSHSQRGIAYRPHRSRAGRDGSVVDLFAMGKAIGRTHESCGHSELLLLGKIHRWDALFFVIAQTAGGTLGVLVVASFIGHLSSIQCIHFGHKPSLE